MLPQRRLEAGESKLGAKLQVKKGVPQSIWGTTARTFTNDYRIQIIAMRSVILDGSTYNDFVTHPTYTND